MLNGFRVETYSPQVPIWRERNGCATAGPNVVGVVPAAVDVAGNTVRRTVIASRTAGATPLRRVKLCDRSNGIKGHRQKAMRTRLEAASLPRTSHSFERIKPLWLPNRSNSGADATSSRPFVRKLAGRGLLRHLRPVVQESF